MLLGLLAEAVQVHYIFLNVRRIQREMWGVMSVRLPKWSWQREVQGAHRIYCRQLGHRWVSPRLRSWSKASPQNLEQLAASDEGGTPSGWGQLGPSGAACM